MLLQTLKTLASYAKFYKANLLVVIVSLIGVSVSLLMIGKIFKNLVDHGLKVSNSISINQSIWLICFFIFIFGISSFFRSYFINLVAEKIITDIKIKIYTHLINCEVALFENLAVGDLISRFSFDAEQLAKLIVNFCSFFLRNSLMLVGSIILMFFESSKLSIIVLLSIPVLLFPLLKLSQYVRKLSQVTVDFQGALAANIDESFSNIRTIGAYNLQQSRINEFESSTQRYLASSSARLKIRSLFFALAICAILLSITLVLWIGSRDIVNGDISSGQIISFIYFAFIAGVSGGGIAELLSEMQLPLASATRIFSLLQYKTAQEQTVLTEHNLTELKAPLIIEFDKVNFTYPTRSSQALKNVSFKLDTEFTGIIGASGSGKSTILQLLLKFYQIDNGNIKINDQNITNLSTDTLRNLISYVPQEPSIFSGTIFSNIALVKTAAKAEEIQKVADITGVSDFAAKLPNGLNTEIGERGVKLSGGQKQRIALARALLHDAKILLLDEATSGLDSNDEALLFNDLLSFIRAKKIIWIAHRLSSLQNAQQIIVINDGKLLFQGNNSQFLAKKEFLQTLSIE